MSALLWCAPARADDVPQGDAFAVNGAEAGNQTEPQAASDTSGNVVVVWREDFTSNPFPGVPGGIYARLYVADGTAKTGNLRVSGGSGTLGLDVAFAPDGSFLVVWGSGGDLLARRFDGSGNPLAPAFTMAFRAPGAGPAPQDPALSFKADGSYVVAWQRGDFVFIQRFGANDQPIGSGSGAGGSFSPAQQADVAYVPGSNSVILVYRTFGDIRGVMFNESTSAAGLDEVGSQQDPISIQIDTSTNTGTSDGTPRLAMGTGGQYLVAWNVGVGSNATRPGGVYARAYTLKTAAGAAFLVNAPLAQGETGQRQDVEIVHDLATGDWLAAYATRNATLSGPSDIRARRLGPGGPLGDEFVANPAGTVAVLPALTTPRQGIYTLAWTGGGDVFGRRFGPAPPVVIDLSVTLNDSRDPVRVGETEPIGYSFNVINNDADDAATEIFVSLTSSIDGLRVTSAGAFACERLGERFTSCSLASALPPGEFRTIIASLPVPDSKQLIELTGSASGIQTDPLPDNNAETETTQVLHNGFIRFVNEGGQQAPLIDSPERGVVNVQVERVGGTDEAASVDISTGPVAPPQAGVGDFLFDDETLSWADGEGGVQTVQVRISEDTLDEAGERLQLELDHYVVARPAAPDTAQVRIIDDDDPPVAHLESTGQTAPEGGAAVSMGVSLDTASGKEVRIGYTLGGSAVLDSDYLASPASPLVIPAGQTRTELRLSPIDDPVVEPEERIEVTLQSADNATLQAQGPFVAVIPASDQPFNPGTLAFITGFGNVLEEHGTLAVAVRRVGGADGPASVRVRSSDATAHAGSDYTATDVTLQWAAGDTANKVVQIPILNDTLVEGDDRFLLSLSDASGAALGTPAVLDVKIFDDDRARVAFRTQTLEVEEGSLAVAAVLLAEPAERDIEVEVQVGGSATPSSDFVAPPPSVTIPAGATEARLEIQTLDDAEPEPVQSILLTITEVRVISKAGALAENPAPLTISIADNDRGTGDTRPEAFTLQLPGGQTAVTGLAPGAAVTTDPLTVTGIGGDAPISIRTSGAGAKAAGPGGAEYCVNDGPFTQADGIVHNGDRVRVRVFAPSAPGATTTATLAIGGVSSSLSVTTAGVTSATASSGGSVGWLTLLGLLPALLRRRTLRRS
ncbi:MAG TPA: Calx-beta domain-containing protein [Solimonas sp.]|nr:Calx-beta domain-containing protein [Solimonas sp.]